MSAGTPQEFLCTPRLPELSLAFWTAAGEAATPTTLGGMLVDDAFPPLPANSPACTKKDVVDKLVDGDTVPIDLMALFEAAVRPGTDVPDAGPLRKLTEQHRQPCDTLHVTEDALRSARQDVVHQRKMHDAATEHLQSHIDHPPSHIDHLQVQFTKLVQTLDRNRTSSEGAGTVDTRIQLAAKTLLSLARKLPPSSTPVSDALQSALQKLRPASYPQIDKHHAAWYLSLPVLLTAWVARGPLTLQDLRLCFAQLDSTLDMPPPAATATARCPRQSPIVDLTGADDPVPSVSPVPTSGSMPLDVAAPVSPETDRTPDGVPPVFRGFLTWLNTVDDKKVGGLAHAFHLAMQLAAYDVPYFPHDSLRRQWESLRASLPLRPVVTKAVADFVKAHPQDDPSVPAAELHPAVQAQKPILTRRNFRWAVMSNGLLCQTPPPSPCVREC